MNFEEEAHTIYRAYVTGTIFNTVAFLEATINELFSDATENPTAHSIEKLARTVKSELAGWWEFGVEKKFSTLDKFDAALLIAGKPKMNRGASIYQNAKYLISLRNTLIHYKSEWLPTHKQTAHRIEVGLTRLREPIRVKG